MTTVTQAPEMIRSRQQVDLIEWALNETGNLNLVARAGCGKTTALKMLVEELKDHPSNSRGIALCAFSADISAVLKAWLIEKGIPWNKAVAKTVHGLGFSAWLKIAPKACDEPDENKVAKIFDERWPAAEAGSTIYMHSELEGRSGVATVEHPERQYRSFVIKAVDMAKQRAFGVLCSIEDKAKWFEMVDHFGLEEALEEDDLNLNVEYGVDLAIRVYKRSLELCREVIDFNDMILAPLYFRARMWTYSWVLVDEAQDTNPARRALLLKVLAPGGRFVAVGDQHQAVFGFTGADSDSLNLIKKALNSKELPLNRTYRCAKSVVADANRFVPDIEAADGNPDGVTRTIQFEDFSKEVLHSTDAILCRKSAPLVELAYSLLRRGIACKVEGREIGEGIVKLINRFKVKSISALLNKLAEYREREIQKWLAKEKEEKAGNVADQCDTVSVLAEQLLGEGKTDVYDLKNFVLGMFGDKVKHVVTLATVHKSKGREWERVFILGMNAYMPSKWARKEWQMEQEDNLCYVAITRAKNELVYVDVKVEVASKRSAA